MAPCKIAIVCTHPIQYSAPVFRALANLDAIDLMVFYTWSQVENENIFDVGFGAEVKWDVPLLEGYAYRFVPNVSKRPGPHHFGGLVNPSLVAEIETWEPDAVLVYTWNSRSHLKALRHFKGRLPVLFRGDSTVIDRRVWWRAALRRLFLTWVYSHVDVAISVGTNNSEYFKWCGLRRSRIALAPHSIDTVRFCSNYAMHEQIANQWREALGITPESVVVLFAGKLQYKKNPLLLLDAFTSLDRRAHLVYVGNGELENELRSKSAAFENVHFIPFQNQTAMPAVYRLGDIFVLPSQGPEETWGLALNEAMASGRAVVASSMVGGARDLIQSREVGWVFESGDRRALESVLVDAIDTGRLGLHAMGYAAQALSVHWSSEQSAQCIRDAIVVAHRQSLGTR